MGFPSDDSGLASSDVASFCEFPTYSGCFDVTDYGALGDGVADDTVAIQTAIDIAISGGSNAFIYFPSGTYNVCRQTDTYNVDLYQPIFNLTASGVPNNICFIGDGPDVSVLKGFMTGLQDPATQWNVTNDEGLSRFIMFYAALSNPNNFSGLQFRSLTIDGQAGYTGDVIVGGTFKFASVTVASGGTGYQVNDVLTVNNGLLISGFEDETAQFLVTSVSGGVITGVTLQAAGRYQVISLAAGHYTTTGGHGTGATFTATRELTGDGWDITHKAFFLFRGDNVLIYNCDLKNWKGEIVFGGSNRRVSILGTRNNKGKIRSANSSAISIGANLLVCDMELGGDGSDDSQLVYNGTENFAFEAGQKTICRRTSVHAGVGNGFVHLGILGSALTVEDCDITGRILLSEIGYNMTFKNNRFYDPSTILTSILDLYNYPDIGFHNVLVEGNAIYGSSPGSFTRGLLTLQNGISDGFVVRNNIIFNRDGITLLLGGGIFQPGCICEDTILINAAQPHDLNTLTYIPLWLDTIPTIGERTGELLNSTGTQTIFPTADLMFVFGNDSNCDVQIDDTQMSKYPDGFETVFHFNPFNSTFLYTLKKNAAWNAFPNDVPVTDNLRIKMNGDRLFEVVPSRPIVNIKIIDPDNGPLTDYTSLAAWWAAEGSGVDLTALNEIRIAECRSTGTTLDTTAVNATGATTDSTRYFVIRSNGAYRHNGNWNTTKYRLVVSGAKALIAGPNTRITGLQIQGNTTDVLDVRSNVIISNSIIKLSNSVAGIADSSNAGTGIEAFNNVIINTDNTATNGILCAGSTITAENNTLIGFGSSNVGMKQTSGTMVARNTLSKGFSNTNTYVGTFAAGTDHNTTDSSDSIGTGSNNHVSQTFSFRGESQDDYYLLTADTGARGQGTTLVSVSGGFTDDIIGETRPDSGAIDAGAFQYPLITPVVAGTLVSSLVLDTSASFDYATVTGGVPLYSDGLKRSTTSGSGYVNAGTTQSGATASFTDTGLTPDTDYYYIVETDDDAFQSSISNEVHIHTQTNDAPPTVVTYIIDPDNGPGTDYLGLQFAAEGLAQDLVANNRILILECRSSAGTADNNGGGASAGDGAYFGAFNTYVTDADHYIIIQSSGSHKHTGKFSTSKYRYLHTGFGTHGGAILMAPYTKLRGIQMQWLTGSGFLVGWATNTEMSDCIIDIEVASSSAVFGSEEQGVHMFNNLFIFDNLTGDPAIKFDAEAIVVFENNTCINKSPGVRTLWEQVTGGGSVLARNNLFKQANGFNPTLIFSAGFASGSDNNSTDASALTNPNGVNDHISQTFTFTDFSGGDYSLAAGDTGARHNGTLLTDTTSGFADDIIGHIRPGFDPIDCGCFQYGSAVPACFFRFF